MLANKHMEQCNKPKLLLISLPAGQYNELPNILFASNILRLVLKKIKLKNSNRRVENWTNHTSQTRCILFLLCLDKYLPTRTVVCNVEINQMFKIIKNTFLNAIGKERCGMKGQVLKWTYRQ